ncbi:phospholipase D-like domain-containing protein [Pigmentibacter sp. JX0631]|uniref:phospholipase D-like domain-containing protein n=1 Tax=Pigmentibacter sp. JX0631 TaxID=2976982 RepID=UPI002468EA22|nr:phospholipase D-like domain-containing protein [Pigmentibacter sp. JX0631]WGL60712.1 phospholipase D-like domain-containing protein [Pigmentibacter sp. JX0631]
MLFKIKLFILVCLFFVKYYANAQYNSSDLYLSYNFMKNLYLKYQENQPNWGGLVGLLPLNNWSHNINDFSINLWRTPISKEYPTKQFVDYVEYSVARTENVVHISTLWFTPGNSMEEALKRAISYLNQKSFEQQKFIRIRIMFSMYKASPLPTKNATEKVIEYLLPEGISPYLDLSVINYRNPVAFNHSKIIAIDRDQLFTGGANFPDRDYDDLEDPVNDLTIELNLPYVAELGRVYLSKIALESKLGDEFSLNSIACTNTEKSECTVSNRWYEPTDPNLNIFNIPVILQNYNKEYILGAGKMMSAKDYNDAEFSTNALLSMMDNAQYEINISQQSIRNITPNSTEIQNSTCAVIGKALSRGVKVNILLSSFSGQGPLLGYTESSFSDKATIKCIIKNTIDTYSIDPTGALERLSILRIARWFNFNGYKYGSARNHVKLIMADNKMAYIGSENLYYNNHAEFGIFIHSDLLVSKVRKEYWDPSYARAYSSYSSN